MLYGSNQGVGRALVPVTKSDTAQPQALRALYVGVAGSVVAQGRNLVDVTFPDVPAGTTLIGEFALIKTASTASALVGYV